MYNFNEISRLPGIRKIKRNDVVVFNDPYSRSRDSISMDVMRYHVKHCVALPGDTFEIKQGVNQVKGFDGELGNVERQRLLPESYIVGVATLIWKSENMETGKMRWDRVLKAIE